MNAPYDIEILRTIANRVDMIRHTPPGVPAPVAAQRGQDAYDAGFEQACALIARMLLKMTEAR